MSDTRLAYGPPTWSSAALNSLRFHLHRYLAPFLDAHNIENVQVMCGFDGTATQAVGLRISTTDTAILETLPAFDALAQHARQPNNAAPPSYASFVGRAIHELHTDEPQPQLLAMVFVHQAHQATLEAHSADLCERVFEAVRASRFNRMRMFFDDTAEYPTKRFIYELFDELPGWCGVDHSSAILLTSTLEAMALANVDHAEFEVVGERMFYPRADDGSPERLVGLVIHGTGANSGLLGSAFRRLQLTRQTGLLIFIPEGDDHQQWSLFGEPDHVAERFATFVERPDEGMTVLLPLLTSRARGDRELLGFLSLNFRRPVPISGLTADLLGQLGERIAQRLQHSSLFSLSAQQLLLIERVRGTYNDTIGGGGARKRLDDYIDRVNTLIQGSTKIPCFAVGYVSTLGQERVVRFVHPKGFTRFDALSLPIEPNGQVQQSSIASLAIRLNEPMILVGQQDPDHPTPQNNALMINESRGEMIDARVHDPAQLRAADGWRALSTYFKPAREQSYATLAFPITLGHDVLGVLSLEVDRSTDWFWWTGFGSRSFYRLLANELAVALKLMGVPSVR